MRLAHVIGGYSAAQHLAAYDVTPNIYGTMTKRKSRPQTLASVCENNNGHEAIEADSAPVGATTH